MQAHIRRSLAAKIVAIGFIVLILMGNFLFVWQIGGQEPKEWTRVAGLAGLAMVLGGGVFLLGHIAKDYLEQRGDS